MTAGGLCRLSMQLHDDGGLWVSMDSQAKSQVLDHALQPVPSGVADIDESSEFRAGGRLNLGIRRSSDGSLAFLVDAMMAGTARTVRTL
jgi:hypothetical protein